MICWEIDRDAKAVIVIVHGAQEYYKRYKWLGMKCNMSGYHVITGDLPGHGNNAKKRGHIHSFHEYIEEVTSWVKEAEKYNLPVFLFGHSMGGLTAIRTMVEKDCKVQGVLLSSPCLEIKAKPAKILEILSKPLNKLIPSMLFPSTVRPEIATSNPEMIDFYYNDSEMLTKVSVRWFREFDDNIQIAHKKVSEFPEVPLLLMQAGDDKLVDKVRVKEWFNKVNLQEKVYKEWDGLYHELFNEVKKEEVYTYMNNFIEGHLPN